MIVQAVGIAVSQGSSEEPRTKQIAEAMRQALIKAQADRITDQDALRGVMLAARDKFLEGK
jgi:hypothetical protein